jgi:Flp pilus assembly protein TadD
MTGKPEGHQARQDRVMRTLSLRKSRDTAIFLPASAFMHQTARTALLAMLIASPLALAGCSSRLQNFTGSVSEIGRGGSETSNESLAGLARRYDSRPGAKQASLEYAAALRTNGQHPQAVAVLQRASVANVGDREVSAAYGTALADVGRFDEANAVLTQAHTEDRPNWRVLSTLGSVADQMGNHAKARQYYHRALQLAPGQAVILNNLGLSYLLTKELKLAEETLRKAAAQPDSNPRIAGNLALALRLQGKTSEATAVEVQGVPRKRPGATAVSMHRPPAPAQKAKAPEKAQ